MRFFDIISDITFRREYVDHFKKVRSTDQLIQGTETYVLSPICVQDICKLRDGSYRHSIPVREKQFFGNDEKTRNIYSFPEQEKCLMRLVVYAMHKCSDILPVCCKYGAKERALWESDLRSIKDYGKLYYFRTDIHRYFDSIDREILCSKIAAFAECVPALKNYLLDFASDTRCMVKGSICNERHAVPTGIPMANFFARLYLAELDEFLMPQSDFYTRNNDCFIIGSHDPEKLRKLSDGAIDILKRLKLKINEDETFFLNPGEPLNYRGRKIAGAVIDFSEDELARIKKDLRDHAAAIKKQLSRSSMATDAKGLVCMYLLLNTSEYRYLKASFPTVTTAASYKLVDHLIQNLLREVITGKSGKGKYALTYAEMRGFGYKPLTAQYYKYIKGQKRKYENNSEKRNFHTEDSEN